MRGKTAWRLVAIGPLTMAALASILAWYHWTAGSHPNTLMFANRVGATVVSTAILRETVDRRQDLLRFTPIVNVRYSIDDAEFQSNLEGILDRGPSTFSQEEAELAMQPFAVGLVVFVRYFSSEPGRSFADRTDWTIILPIFLTVLSAMLWPLGAIICKILWI
ncbi:MAG: hypothetical protein KDK89_17455 [Alphaproteobacteria bacterium]|nr:hypothetical protein [Alphaproteobacteria bacterium]